MTLACHTYMRIKLCKQTRRGIFLSSRKHFTNSSSSSRGNGDNNANKEDGGQRAGWRVAVGGSRKQRPEVRHIFRLKCHNMLTSSRDNDSDNELNEQHQPGSNNLTYIFIFIFILFLSARAIVGFITFIVAVLVVIVVASLHGNSVKKVM